VSASCRCRSLLAAVGIPRVFPNAWPRRVAQFGFLALLAGIVVMVAALDAGAGPALAAAVLISALTASFLSGIQAGVAPKTTDAIVAENGAARINGLRASLSVLAVVALIALFFTRRLPTPQPAHTSTDEPPP
jgi:hypothetical protein